MARDPVVSVIIATWGRPHVLRHAIGCALGQTLREIEVIVVGDCTDAETVRVISSIKDSRLRFINLPINYGEQSGPNNIGVLSAQGEYVAFLNHDDFWFPDHLATALTWLQASGSDLCFTGAAVLVPPEVQKENADFPWLVGFLGQTGDALYTPLTLHVPASLWVLKREIHENLAGWRPAAECRRESSRDFLLRAWRSGYRMRSVPIVSAILLPSTARQDSYLEQISGTHDKIASMLSGGPASLRATLCDRMVEGPGPRLGARLLKPLKLAAIRLGLHPVLLHGRRKPLTRKGEQIDHLRRQRGLPKLARSGASIEMLKYHAARLACPDTRTGDAIDFSTSGSGSRHKAGGWAPSTADGSWMNSAQASLVIRTRKGAMSPLGVSVTGRVGSEGQRIELLAAGKLIGVIEGKNELSVWQFSIPHAAVEPDGLVELELRELSAHRMTRSRDKGLFLLARLELVKPD
ncbi:MAG: glycosyltransferase family 2 protein [Rhizobiaceae bacterium]